MDTKVCSKCKEVKTLDGFSKDKAKKDGYQYKCKTCVKIYQAEYHASNPEKRKERDAEYHASNPEKVRERQAKYRAANPEKKKESNAKWCAANPDYHAEYQKANLEKGRAKEAKRRAIKLKAIPKWLTEEDWQSMEDIGKEADRLTRETGIKHEVDHIIPLQPPKVFRFEGKMIPLICAFHCPQNLQILTRSENRSKRNKFKPYVESEI